jgi:hypothetical protein
MESDADLAERVLIVGYGELCRSLGEGLQRMFAHVGFGVESETIESLAGTLQAPRYYELGFSEDEKAMIRDVTDAFQIRF